MSQQGSESVFSSIPNDGINPVHLNLIRDWPLDGASMGLSQTHQSTPAHPTPSNLSAVPPTLPVISCKQTILQDKERRVTQWPHQFQKMELDPVASLSRPSLSLPPGEKPGVSQGRHPCSICKLDYAQPQGLTRHLGEKHRARLCIYCREFEWGRPYLFREHLGKHHPGVDPNAAIEAARTRRSATA